MRLYVYFLDISFIFQGEATWTIPDSLQKSLATSRAGTAAGSVAEDTRPGFGNGWTSYLDEETGQMYWHNVHTGEVQWDY